MGDEGVDILDASLKVVNMLNLECTNEDTVDQLNHIEGRDTKRASNIEKVNIVAIAIIGYGILITATELGEGFSG